MLVALVTLLLLGGDGGLDIFGKDARKLVQEIVVNDERADAVVAEMKSSQKSINKAHKQIGKLFKSWEKTDDHSSSGRAELESKLREADELRLDAMRTFTDSIFHFREHMTADEWAALHKASEVDG